MATVKKHSEVKSLLSSLLHRRYITAEDTTLRCLLDPKVDKKAADARLYKLVTDILRKDPDHWRSILPTGSALFFQKYSNFY